MPHLGAAERAAPPEGAAEREREAHNALAALVAELAGQHEHLRQSSLASDRALAAADAALGRARALLARAPERAEELPAVPSEWRRALHAAGGAEAEARPAEAAAPEARPAEAAPLEVRLGRRPSAWELLGGESSWPSACEGRWAEGLHPSRCEAGEGGALERRALAAHQDPQVDALPHPRLSRSSSASQESWNEGMNLVRRNAVFRLQARLGKRNFRGNATAEDVHKAVTSLGLVKYSLCDIEQWLSVVKVVHSEQGTTQRRSSSLGSAMRTLRVSRSRTFGSDESSDLPEARASAIRFRSLVETLLDDEKLSLLELKYQKMSLTIREVLFSGDANRLVAELTHVRVDDVAAPMDRPEFMTYMEPVVGFMIVINGFCIGLQTSEVDSEVGDAWFWLNTAFTVFFVLEIALRAFLTGFKAFFSGPDHSWNIFDSTIILVSVCDIVLEAAAAGSGVAPLTVMRVLRLARLTRLLRLFRLRYMKELSLMVRGLLGGLQTLFWAVVLLFFTLYVIAILATSTIGKDTESVPGIPVEDELFSSVPRAFFTAFRCFMGDCATSEGKPIVKILSNSYGPIFVICYFASMIFVTFGLFNLIVAIYIENTLNAAKTEGEKTKHQRQRESVRIARLTRQLLKKFCAAQKLWTDGQGSNSHSHKEVKRILNASVFDDVGEISMPVSKEMFLCVIQDTSVQKLMDDLDIPPDRASLFDILDADGSGGLEVSELITGLLRVRGEAKKSDIVGTLLAVRVVQEAQKDQARALERLELALARAPRP